MRIEVSALHRDGHEFPVDLTIWPVRTAGHVRFSALVDDITVRKQLEEQLRHQALHDPLTGLANRVLFADRLHRALAVAPTGEDGSVAILFIDLDDFKNVNQEIGRAAGDELLVAVATRIGTGLRPADTAARVGGEEFAVLLEQADHARPARLAARLLRLIAEPFRLHGKEVRITASIGIALHGAEGTTAEELLRNANLAMSAAKAKGRAARSCIGAACIARPCAALRSRRPSKRPSRTGASKSITSRSSDLPMGWSPGSRLSCAGSTRTTSLSRSRR